MTDCWNGCYDEGWKGIIVDEAFQHPAKISYALVARIYEHAFKMGWVKPGDTVVDPFGGICGTALHAATHGLRWIGCELEPKFHSLGNQIIDLWQKRWGHCPEWVRPTIHCGDSRRLAEVIGMAELCVSSPPYANQPIDSDNQRRCGDTEYKIKSGWDAYRASGGGLTLEGFIAQQERHSFEYGEAAGQLGAMVVGSPPFEAGAEGGFRKGKFKDQESYIEIHAAGGSNGKGHGCTPEAARRQMERDEQKTYGDSKGNIGNQSGDTFWESAAIIVRQCHAILRPGGHAIWVTKNFVRKKQIVPFSDQWLALCESIGFRLVCRHRAMLVKTGGTQRLLDGGEHTHQTSRKSFFRRLAEKKGSPRIDWEDVICLQK